MHAVADIRVHRAEPAFEQVVAILEMPVHHLERFLEPPRFELLHHGRALAARNEYFLLHKACAMYSHRLRIMEPDKPFGAFRVSHRPVQLSFPVVMLAEILCDRTGLENGNTLVDKAWHPA